jgi:Protein of unknown function (DUF2589)
VAKRSTRSLSPASESSLPSKPSTSKSASVRDATKMVDEVVQSTTGSVMRAASAARALTAAAVSTDLSSELNNIDFRKMIGGPLQAAVDAQVASSMATVDFINKVGFKDVTATDGTVTRELVMVDFSHKRVDVNADGDLVPTEVFIKVPLLAMLPIPSLRIEHVIIDFNVKLNSVQSSSTEDTLKIDAEVGGRFGPVNFKVSASYQRKTATNVEVKKEYALNINVKAVQDEIPAGLEKILNLLAA